MDWNDPEKRREYHRKYIREWRKNNKDKVLKYRAKQEAKPERKEQKKLALARWRKRHPETHRENSKRWRRVNMAYVLFMNAQRRVRKKANGKHTYKQWLDLKEKYNYTCPACGKAEPEVKLTEDHIIPISKGGSNNIENIQPLCKICNCRKYKDVIKYEI